MAAEGMAAPLASTPATGTAGLPAFAFRLPTELRFGAGCRREVGEIARRYGRRVALFSGQRSLERSGGAGDIFDSLAAAGIEVVARLTAGGEPDAPAVGRAAKVLSECRPDALVAVGGGSTLDLAKAAAVVAGAATGLDGLWSARIELPWRPLVCLPTTAGSGAEASWGAIVLDTVSGRKRGLRGPGIAARVALVDPELTVSAGEDVTAQAGFDALAHAVETAASRAAQPLTTLLSAEAFRRLVVHLPRAVASPADLIARSENAYAALLMGINLANSTTCLPHRLQYPVGALTGTAHGRGVAALFPAWLARTVEQAPASLAGLARACGLAADADGDGVAAAALARAVQALRRAIGLEVRLADLGVQAADVPELVARVEGSLANDPGPSAPADLAALYRASL